MTDSLTGSGCKGRSRTFTRWLALVQKKDSGQPVILRLSQIPHPRDRRAWLPVSSPHSVIEW